MVQRRIITLLFINIYIFQMEKNGLICLFMKYELGFIVLTTPPPLKKKTFENFG